ncbi:hypothetical protein TNCV_3593861 [Trichonephila clavipes]|nr:hypothetical protein TNCV_3593861 [Trichonephila clavipes]
MVWNLALEVEMGVPWGKREPQEGEDRCSGGSHGYDNLFPDMKAFFMALGPSMKKNFTAEPFLNIELYELMCATRGLLATDHVILNHGQVTWTTPELAPPSPNYHTTPTGGRFSSRQI